MDNPAALSISAKRRFLMDRLRICGIALLLFTVIDAIEGVMRVFLTTSDREELLNGLMEPGMEISENVVLILTGIFIAVFSGIRVLLHCLVAIPAIRRGKGKKTGKIAYIVIAFIFLASSLFLFFGQFIQIFSYEGGIVKYVSDDINSFYFLIVTSIVDLTSLIALIGTIVYSIRLNILEKQYEQ